jgi:bla regulator protein BlaR1
MIFIRSPLVKSHSRKKSGGTSAKAAGLCVIVLLSGSSILGQPQRSEPLAFDVVSIKADKSGERDIAMVPSPGGRFTVTNVPVKLLIRLAFGTLNDSEISGKPGWTSTERYDIEAKAEGIPNLTNEQLGPMLQVLLADRFHLRTHRETKEIPIFALVVAKGGPKFHERTDGKGDGRVRIRGTQLTGEGVSMAWLAKSLPGLAPREIDRPVLDMTGLTGVYDFKLERDETQATPEANPSVFTSIQEQLGLKVEPRKGPIQVLIVDQVDRPSEN